MIKSKEEILKVLDEYVKVYYEWVYQLYMPNCKEWTNEKMVMYSNGVVFGKFRESDSSIMKILKEGIADDLLSKEIDVNIKYQIAKYKKVEQLDIMDERKYKLEQEKLNDLKKYPIDDWIQKYFGWMIEKFIGVSYSEGRVLIYLHHALENYYIQQHHPYNNNLEQLEKAYENVLDKHSQFYKYGIITVENEQRELIVTNPPRIYDKSINKTFFTKNVPLNVLQEIYKIIEKEQIGEFSIRLMNEPGYIGKMYSQYLAESLEFGKLFNFANLKNYSVSRLYSEKYDNCLWVKIEPKSIIFEELCEDFEDFQDSVVTQVVHLEYDVEDDIAYIIHMDHEYIFYTIEEYEKRCTDSKQKGTAQPRMKSFKIDNARIPFDTRCNIERRNIEGDKIIEDEQFLCFILESYFRHKDLLREYFQNL